jgi:hypothetical protein
MLIISNNEDNNIIDLIPTLNPKDKTIVVAPTYIQLKLLVERIVDRYPNFGLDKVELIEYIRISNMFFMPVIDSNKIRGMRCKNIIMYEYNHIDNDAKNNIIIGYLRNDYGK